MKVGGKIKLPPALGLDRRLQGYELGFAADRHVVEVPERDQHAPRAQCIADIDMGTKLVLAARHVALDPKFSKARSCGTHFGPQSLT